MLGITFGPGSGGGVTAFGVRTNDTGVTIDNTNASRLGLQPKAVVLTSSPKLILPANVIVPTPASTAITPTSLMPASSWLLVVVGVIAAGATAWALDQKGIFR